MRTCAKEFQTPTFLSRGNVGTSTEEILQNAKHLPSKVFHRLGISLKYKGKRAVPPLRQLGFDGERFSLEEQYSWAAHHKDHPEEFDRHLALHPEEQAMHNERNDRMPTRYKLFEQQFVRNPWDKGDGSGLVFYTDDSYWDNKISRDERLVDDWDVHYDDQDPPAREGLKRGKHTRHARVKRRKLNAPKSKKKEPAAPPPIPPTDFSSNRPSWAPSSFPPDSVPHLYMQAHGWTPGAGLGKSEQGDPEPIVVRKRRTHEGLGFSADPATAPPRSGAPFEPTYRRILRENPMRYPKEKLLDVEKEAEEIEQEEQAMRKQREPLITSILEWKPPAVQDNLGSYRLDDMD